jgi:hypothetical protein
VVDQVPVAGIVEAVDPLPLGGLAEVIVAFVPKFVELEVGSAFIWILNTSPADFPEFL